ncbi:hypothetical protein GF357_00790 [Candidatus Dojkabacteria bacterium]|nr:hypothetical protein [Candidatus Dojkabacteria bacterium]
MKIYFTASTAKFNQFKSTYFKIRKILIDQGHVLTRDWLPHTEKLIETKKHKLRNIKNIYKACIKSIREADAVIIEDTVSNFSTGHQITKALQMKKPTLVLWQKTKNRQFNQMFIHGLESNLLEIVEYNTGNLEETILIFLRKFRNIAKKNRFHLVLDNLERSYIDWAQHNYGKSRTQVIRDSIRKALDEDEEYKKYLTQN